MSTAKKKKKVDYEALSSPFMRIPRMDVETARALLDLGYRECFELQGRSPETLFDEMTKRNPEISKFHLPRLKMAVYYIEADDPDMSLMDPKAWT